ncbi:MAG: DUF4173 domain-containing protein, partial [Chitinophagaceae bacterium]
LAGHLVAVAMLIVFNTLLSKVVAVLSLFLFAGFAEYVHRSVVFAAGSIMIQTSLLVAEFSELLRQSSGKKKLGRKPRLHLRLLLLPLILVGFFLLLYLGGNKAFAKVFSDFFNSFSSYFEKLLSWISWGRLFFMLLGAYITGSLIMRTRVGRLADRELSFSDRLLRVRQRQRARKPRTDQTPRAYPLPEYVVETQSSSTGAGGLAKLMLGRMSTGILALKNKNQVGLVSLVLLNILLVLINITDVIYIWTNNDYGKDQSLTELLHEGTGVLILSVVLAMMVVLFFFNGNINFYRKNKALKFAAFAWLGQNIFLVASVFMRDYYYISHFGLAYKRIGVLFFLAVVLTGILSVIIKINRKKSTYYLFRVNGNALVILMIIASTMNWDVLIARYNLSRMNQIKPDIEFLLNLSEKTIPILRQHEKELTQLTANQVYYFGISDVITSDDSFGGYSSGRHRGRPFSEFLQDKEDRYLRRQARLS